MKFIFKLSTLKPLTCEQIKTVLPGNFLFTVPQDDSRSLLTVEESNGVSEQKVCWNVLKECDRIAFLTGVQLNPGLLCKVRTDGSTEVTHSISSCTVVVKPSALDNVVSQNWEIPEASVAVQLRLWQLATPDLPVAARINLLFQIVEIAHPERSEYPKYEDSTKEPDPMTEARFLRNLASHGKQAIGDKQLQLYCQRHGLPLEMHDPTNPTLIKLLEDRLEVVKSEARRVIDSSITRGTSLRAT